jgi:hypothetical protein
MVIRPVGEEEEESEGEDKDMDMDEAREGSVPKLLTLNQSDIKGEQDTQIIKYLKMICRLTQKIAE